MEGSEGFNPNAYIRTGISLNEVLELKETFDLFDPKKSGLVNSEVLKSALRSLGFEQKNQNIYKIIFGLEGTVDFPGFIDAVAGGLSKEDLQNEADKVYSLFDYDNTGYISSKNLKKAASDLEIPISEEEIQNLLKSANSVSESQISKSDFLNLIQSPN